MPFSHFPHGVSSLGIPQVGAGVSIPNQNGKCFFVDATYGNNFNSGEDPDAAFSTIQKAVDSAGDGDGDTIFVFPGSYTENVIVTKDYVSIVGAMVGGYARPDVVPTTGIPLIVRAEGVTVKHMRFAGTAADGMRQEGNGFVIDDCVFDGDLTAAKAGLRLAGNATDDSLTASEGVVSNSLFRGCAIGICFDTAAVLVGVGSTDNVIVGNRFYANTLDLATADTGTGTYSVRTTLITGNMFMDKNKATYIDFTTANGGAASDQTGAVNGNYFATDTMSTTKIKAVGTGFTFAGNIDTVGIFDGSGLD